MQCAFGTPGQILSAVALLAVHPQATEEEIVGRFITTTVEVKGWEKIEIVETPAFDPALWSEARFVPNRDSRDWGRTTRQEAGRARR